MARFDLYVDVMGKSFVSGERNAKPFQFPNLTQGDTISLRIYLLQRNTNWPQSLPNGAAAYEIINNAAYSLKLGIGTKAGTGDGDLVASQYTWSKDADNEYFYADLPLNTSELNTAIGSGQTLSQVLEIEVTQGGLPTTVIQQAVTIDADVIKNAAVTVQPGETALSAEVANATYAKLYGDAGATITLVSPNGLWARILGINDDGTRIDSVEQIS